MDTRCNGTVIMPREVYDFAKTLALSNGEKINGLRMPNMLIMSATISCEINTSQVKVDFEILIDDDFHMVFLGGCNKCSPIEEIIYKLDISYLNITSNLGSDGEFVRLQYMNASDALICTVENQPCYKNPLTGCMSVDKWLVDRPFLVGDTGLVLLPKIVITKTKNTHLIYAGESIKANQIIKTNTGRGGL